MSVLVQFSHGIVAMVMQAPELEFNKEESNAFAGAVAPVLEMANVQLDPRVTKLVVAGMTVFALEAPHIAMWRARVAMDRADRAKPVNGTDRPAPTAEEMGTSYGGYSGPVDGAVN